jgi:hypothetical protein
MTISLIRPDLTNGFRFTRPSAARNGVAESLNEYAKAALSELETRLAKGFPEKTSAIEAEARACEAEADRHEAEVAAKEQVLQQAQLAAAAGESDVQAAEAAETEALSKLEAAQKDKAPPAQLQGQYEQARAKADATRKALDKLKLDVDVAQTRYDNARDAASQPRRRAREARARVQPGVKKLQAVLDYPIYVLGSGATLLSYAPSGPVLADHLDQAGLTAVRDDVKARLSTYLKTLDTNARVILSRPAVVDYLIVRLSNDGLKTADAFYRALTETPKGYKRIYDFVVLRSLALLKDDKHLLVNDDTLRRMAQQLIDSPISLQQETFGAALDSLVDDFVFGKNEQLLLAKATSDLGIVIPPQQASALVEYIRRANEASPQINAQNASYFVSIALAELQKQQAAFSPSVMSGPVTSADYEVSYYTEESQGLEFDRASVQAAAQMFLTMVWGDELGIFEVVNRIAMQSGQQQAIRLEIRSKELATDLRMYALDEEFRDLRTGQIGRRIAPAERQMFYRQLFGFGEAQTPDASQNNSDFRRLWAVLMTEVVKFIGKVEENGTGVSTQKIYQAIEDIQYNLSAFCTGLPKIAAPSMHAELDFVIRRILDSQDVKLQLARRGTPSFWRVVEEVRGMHDFTPLRNKGQFGHMILNTIASATPALLEDQKQLSDFISTVEAYIVAEDQLMEAQQPAPQLGQFPGFFGFDPPAMPNIPGMPSVPGMPFGGASAPAAGSNGHTGTNDWNF